MSCDAIDCGEPAVVTDAIDCGEPVVVTDAIDCGEPTVWTDGSLETMTASFHMEYCKKIAVPVKCRNHRTEYIGPLLNRHQTLLVTYGGENFTIP